MLVSSGAIGVGCQKMGLKTRPTALAQRQAVAAVGQIHLMRYYQEFFQALGLVSYCCMNSPVIQVLLLNLEQILIPTMRPETKLLLCG